MDAEFPLECGRRVRGIQNLSLLIEYMSKKNTLMYNWSLGFFLLSALQV